MDQVRTCSLCRHWVSLWEVKKGRGRARSGDERRSKRGQCRRYAPRASPLTPQWPWTKAYESCGEFQPVDDERRGSRAD